MRLKMHHNDYFEQEIKGTLTHCTFVLQLNHINHHSHDFNAGAVKSAKQTAQILGMCERMPSVT